MSIEREFEGETVTDAAIEACKELGISRDELEFDVVQEESSGVLGPGEMMIFLGFSLVISFKSILSWWCTSV